MFVFDFSDVVSYATLKMIVWQTQRTNMPKVLFVSSIPLYPEGGGGGELSAHTLLETMKEMNWSIETIGQVREMSTSCLPEASFLFGKIYLRLSRAIESLFGVHKFKFENRNGISTWVGDMNSRWSRNFVVKMILKSNPDFVFGHFYSKECDIDILYFAVLLGFPTVCFFRSTGLLELPKRYGYENIQRIANSQYTTELAQRFSGRPIPFICPFIRKEKITAPKKTPSHILFVNPVPSKGVEIFIETAKRMPEETFLVVNGNWWCYDYGSETECSRLIRALPNVTVIEKQTESDMAKIYGVTKILFLPSQAEETFSRLVVEAHYNGIPVVGADMGAISWTLGSGGILIREISNVTAYVDALKRLCNDTDLYKHYSKEALRNSERPEFQIKNSIKKLLNIMKQIIPRQRKTQIQVICSVFLVKIHIAISKLRRLFTYVVKLLLGQIRMEFVRELWRRGSLSKGSLWISLFVTSSCSVNCKECIMGRQRKAFPDYQMNLDEIKRFIHVSEKSHYRFDIIISGGEPLDWDYFKEGVRLLKRSFICNSLHIFTNATDINKLDPKTVDCIDRIRISKYYGNAENTEKLVRLYGPKVEIVYRREFWQNPTSPVPDTLPPHCCNPYCHLFNNRIYACPHSESIVQTSKSKVKLSNPLKIGFMRDLDRIKEAQAQDICSFCISNLNVRKKVAKVSNR